MSRSQFQGTLVGALPVPLPKYFVQGFDFIKWEYEKGYFSYVHGEWRNGSWWYYCLYGLLTKEPLGTWCLFGLAIGMWSGFPSIAP